MENTPPSPLPPDSQTSPHDAAPNRNLSLHHFLTVYLKPTRKLIIASTLTLFAIGSVSAASWFFPKQSKITLPSDASSFSTNNGSSPVPTPTFAQNTPIVSPTLIPPTTSPIPTGTLTGNTIGGYYQTPLTGVAVTLQQNAAIQTVTNNQGNYQLQNIPYGTYTVVFSHPDYTFPNLTNIQLSQPTKSLNPILGSLKNPQPKTITVTAFSDNNYNHTKDSGEDSLSMVLSVVLQTVSGQSTYQSFIIDDSGTKTFDIFPQGKYYLVPGVKTFYQEPGSQEIIVDGTKGNVTFQFPYAPKTSQGGLIIYVFNDKNENGNKDNDEEYIHYQYANVLYHNAHESRHVAIPPEGDHELDLGLGDYTIELVPETSAWAAAYTITKGSVFITVQPGSSPQTVELGAHKLY